MNLKLKIDHSHALCPRELPVSLCAGRGVKVESILKDDETLTSFLLRDVPLTESVVYQLVNAQIRPEQVHRHMHKHTPTQQGCWVCSVAFYSFSHIPPCMVPSWIMQEEVTQ